MGTIELALIAMALLQVGDIVTTRAVLAQGGWEKNPVIAFFMDRFGSKGWIVAKVAMAIAGCWLMYESGYGQAIWALNGFYAYVVWKNYRVWRRHR